MGCTRPLGLNLAVTPDFIAYYIMHYQYDWLTATLCYYTKLADNQSHICITTHFNMHENKEIK